MKLNEIIAVIRSRIDHNKNVIDALSNSMQLGGVRKMHQGENEGLKFVLALLADVEA